MEGTLQKDEGPRGTEEVRVGEFTDSYVVYPRRTTVLSQPTSYVTSTGSKWSIYVFEGWLLGERVHDLSLTGLHDSVSSLLYDWVRVILVRSVIWTGGSSSFGLESLFEDSMSA